MISFAVNDATVLFSFESNDLGCLDLLATEVNNVLSHHYLVDKLKMRYGINSDYHLSKRIKPINEIKQHTNNPILLHSYGVMLYDIERTATRVQDYVCTVKSLHPEIKRAYMVCKKYLAKVKLCLATNEQQSLCELFFKDLGYKNCFKVYSGKPTD